MNITVNNNIQALQTNSTVEMMVDQLKIESRGIAIAVNHTVISKSEWSQKILKENDNITIIKATQGG